MTLAMDNPQQYERQPGETKTAWRRRNKAAAKALANARLTEAARQLAKDQRDREMARLNLIYCSDWWAEEMRLGRGPYYPNTPCSCEKCQGRKWPVPVVPPRCISYECHILDIADRLHGDNNVDEIERWGRRRYNKRQAGEAGLHMVRQRQSEIQLLVSGCERCEGLRPFGERYCMACAAAVRREMREAGYL